MDDAVECPEKPDAAYTLPPAMQHAINEARARLSAAMDEADTLTGDARWLAIRAATARWDQEFLAAALLDCR